jgi:cytidine deaminase
MDPWRPFRRPARRALLSKKGMSPHPQEPRLLAAALAARQAAHAPYSQFLVGAALLDEAGRIHSGCNVENAAYPLGMCAEAGALSALVLAGGRAVHAVLVVGEVAGRPLAPVTPCGGCRQRLREFAADAVPVLVANPQGVLLRTTLGALLPHSFGPDHLQTTPSSQKDEA